MSICEKISNALISFVDTENYTITQQRDSSYLEYDKNFWYRYVCGSLKLVITLGTVSVKDSIIQKGRSFKTMMNVPFAANWWNFEKFWNKSP